MQIAIIGLPWTGKSTLFNTLAQTAGVGARAAAGTVNQCVVPVPDPRLDRLAELFEPKAKTHATIEYLDVPGLDVRNQSGQGIPGQVLARIKNATALVEVIGGFAPDQPSDPAERVALWRADHEALATEMLIGDLSIVETRRERLAKQLKKGVKGDHGENEREDALLARCEAALSEEQPLRTLEFTAAEHTILSSFQMLSQKPTLYLVNVDEDAVTDAPGWLEAHWGDGTDPPLSFCAAIENEIAALPEEERGAFLEDLGITEPVLPRLIRASQALLGLITFFTAGEKEVRGWPIRRGTRAPQAAGEIHSDLERGFIRAEVTRFEDLSKDGTFAACRDRGALRLEGKEYVVLDGDVMTIRFSV